MNFHAVENVMADFTPTQGRYLAFIHAYTSLHGFPPAESEIAAAMCVSPPSVNQMVKMLERKGLIQRQPGQPRSLRVLVPEDQIPPWNKRKPALSPASANLANRSAAAPQAIPAAPPAKLYVFAVFLTGGPISEKFTNKETSRVIEIRGDQTLAQFHDAIFQAYDRWDQHGYEFQLGKRPFDPDGPTYGVPDGLAGKKQPGDARTTKLDDLGLTLHRTFGYWFDFGDDWFHQVQVERIEQAIPTVTYPRVIKRVGKSPPQYLEK
jgi:pRiA4b ORF-3-like protein/LexA DNA binding domain-containing protein